MEDHGPFIPELSTTGRPCPVEQSAPTPSPRSLGTEGYQDSPSRAGIILQIRT